MRKYIDREILMNRVKNKKGIKDTRVDNQERLVALYNRRFINSYTVSMLNSLEVSYNNLGIIGRMRNKNRHEELKTYIEYLSVYYLNFIRKTMLNTHDHDMFDITDIMSTIVAYNNDVTKDWDSLDEVLTNVDFYKDEPSSINEDKLFGYRYLFVALCIYSRIYSCSILISRLYDLRELCKVINEIAKRYKLSGLENAFIEITESRTVSEKNMSLVLDIIELFESLINE